MNSFDDHSGFIKKNVYYVVSGYNDDSPDPSTYIVERDKHEHLVFKTLSQKIYIGQSENIHKDIVFCLRSLKIEERIKNRSD